MGAVVVTGGLPVAPGAAAAPPALPVTMVVLPQTGVTALGLPAIDGPGPYVVSLPPGLPFTLRFPAGV